VRDVLRRFAGGMARVALCGMLMSLPASCRSEQTSLRPAPEVEAARPYEPLYRSRTGGTRERRGTIRGDFQWAADAPTLVEAATRWQSFLKAHNPPGQEFEDSLHASYVSAAEYELLRVYYLLNRQHEGDELLRRLDPPGWER
jgi:hypothetical protein